MIDNRQFQSDSILFIVFSDDWGVHPSSAQHIFREIAETYSIAWINTVGMRGPVISWSDCEKAARKLGGMLKTGARGEISSDQQRVRVYQPPMIPFNLGLASRWFNNMTVRGAMKRAIRDSQLDRVIVLTTVPNACSFVDAVESDRIVYYCVDDFSEWPGLEKSKILRMEDELLKKVDAIVAVSHGLVKRFEDVPKPVHLLTHGVDLKLFRMRSTEEHVILDRVPSPRLGFFGLFDQRSNQELIASLALRRPDLAIIIAGRVETSIERLRKIPNIYFVGQVPYSELPALVSGLNILFVPYQVDALSNSLSPLKFKEYLATGLPVISTPIAAALEINEYIHIASSLEEWCQEVDACLGLDAKASSRELLAYLDGESWGCKAQLMLDYCVVDRDRFDSNLPADVPGAI